MNKTLLILVFSCTFTGCNSLNLDFNEKTRKETSKEIIKETRKEIIKEKRKEVIKEKRKEIRNDLIKIQENSNSGKRRAARKSVVDAKAKKRLAEKARRQP